jgi:TfoX/Sxy family transcriptional regulator of competence genes
MATPLNYIEYICNQISDINNVRYKKMFGEYMIYVNDKPLLLVCNSTVYIKMRDEIKSLMKNSSRGIPYNGAKEHYILDIDDKEFTIRAITLLDSITPLIKKAK